MDPSYDEHRKELNRSYSNLLYPSSLRQIRGHNSSNGILDSLIALIFLLYSNIIYFFFSSNFFSLYSDNSKVCSFWMLLWNFDSGKGPHPYGLLAVFIHLSVSSSGFHLFSTKILVEGPIFGALYSVTGGRS